MRYPLDKALFIEWVKKQEPTKLVDLKLELLASVTDLNIQLENGMGDDGWVTRASIKLRLTEWRLQVVEVLLDQGALAFQKAAYHLLDRDVYDTILEAANAARVS